MIKELVFVFGAFDRAAVSLLIVAHKAAPSGWQRGDDLIWVGK
jgi:hypothetical protein